MYIYIYNYHYGSEHILRRYKTPPSHHRPVPLPKRVLIWIHMV